MSKANALIESLKQEGRVDSRGEITLDRDKAREKLRKFQLSDPLRYVLELVQAAHAKGATRIRFDIDANDMRLSFDGEPFSLEDFDELYNALLSEGSTVHPPARRLLALGVNAARALEPRQIRIESGRGPEASPGVFLTIDPAQPDSYDTLTENPPAGTTIHVRARFRLGTTARFFQNIAGRLPEERLLRDHCFHATAEVDLEDTILSHGFTVPEALGATDLPDLDQPITLAFNPAAWHAETPAHVRLVSRGVWLTTHRRTDLLPGLIAVVSADHLKKDVSQADFVKDNAYSLLLREVRHGELHLLAHLLSVEPGEAHHEALFRILGFPDEGVDPIQHAKRALHRVVLTRLQSLLRRRKRVWARLVQAFRSEDSDPLAPLLGLELWRDVGNAPVTLRTLCADVDVHGTVLYSRKEGEVPEPDERPLVLQLGLEVDINGITAVFGSKALDITREVEHATKREHNRALWLARKHPPRFIQNIYSVRRAFSLEDGAVQGEIGIHQSPAEGLRISFVVDGCLLTQHEHEHSPVPGLELLVSAALPVTDLCDGIHEDDQLAAALSHLFEVLPELMGELASLPHSRWNEMVIWSFLGLCVEGTTPRSLLSLMGYDHCVARIKRGAYDLAALLRGETPHPIAACPLLPSTTGERLYTLAELREHTGPIFFVEDDAPTLPPLHTFDDAIWEHALNTLQGSHEPQSQRLVLRLELTHFIVLEHLMADRLVDFVLAHESLVKATAFYDQPVMQPRVGSTVKVPLDSHGVSGELGVRAMSGRQRRGHNVKVFKAGRPLGSFRVELPGELEIAANVAIAKPNTSYDGISNEEATAAAIRQAVAQALPELPPRLASAGATEELGEILRAVFPFPTYTKAFNRIEHEQGRDDDARDRLYLGVLALAYSNSLPQVMSLLRELLSRRKKKISPAKLRRHGLSEAPHALAWLDTLFPATDLPLDERVLQPHPALQALPLAKSVQGEDVTLRQVVEHVLENSQLNFAEGWTQPDILGEDELVIEKPDEDTERTLLALFGRDVLNDVTRDLQRRLHEWRFLQRPELDVQRHIDHAALGVVSVEDANGALRGRVGLSREHPRLLASEQRRACTMTLCHRGRELTSRSPVSWSGNLSLVSIIDDDDIVLNDTFTDIERDPHERRRRDLVESARERLLRELAASWSECDAPIDAWRHLLDGLTVFSDGKDPIGRIEETDLGALCDAAGFQTLDASPMSLRDVEQHLDEHNRINILILSEVDVALNAPPERRDYLKGTLPEHLESALRRRSISRETWPWRVLVVGIGEYRVLKKLFGGIKLQNFQPLDDFLRHGLEFLRRPTQPLELPGDPEHPLELEANRLEGRLGLSSSAGEGLELRLFYAQRHLCDLTLDLPGLRLLAAVDTDRVNPNDHWERPASMGALALILRNLAEALPRLLTPVAETHRESPGNSPWRDTLLALLTLPVPTPRFRDALTHLWDSPEQYHALLGLAAATSTERVNTALNEIKMRALDVDGFARALAEEGLDKEREAGTLEYRGTRPANIIPPRNWDAFLNVLFPKTDAPWPERLLEPIALLDGLPLFTRIDHSPLSLADLRATFSEQDVIWVAPPFSRHELARERVVVQIDRDETLQALQRLFGEGHVRDCQPWLEELELKWRFEQRQTLETIALDPAATFASTRVETDGFEGEIALPSHRREDAHIRLCLARREVAADDFHCPVPLIGILNDDDLVMNAAFTEIERDPKRDQRRRVVRDALDPLIAQLVDGWEARADVDERRFVWDLLLSALSHNTTRRHLSESTLERAEALPTLLTLSGERVSLAEVRQAHGDARPVFALSPRAVGLSSTRLLINTTFTAPDLLRALPDEGWTLAGKRIGVTKPHGDWLILILGSDEHSAISRLFEEPEGFADTLAFLQRAHTFYTSTPLADLPTPSSRDTIASVPIEAEGVEGTLSLLDTRQDAPAFAEATLDLYRTRRPLGSYSLRLPAGHALHASVNADALLPDDDFQSARECSALADVRAAVCQALPALIERALEARPAEALTPIFLHFITALAPTPRYRRLLEALPKNLRERDYTTLLVLTAAFGVDDIDAALAERSDSRAHHTVKALCERFEERASEGFELMYGNGASAPAGALSWRSALYDTMPIGVIAKLRHPIAPLRRAHAAYDIQGRRLTLEALCETWEQDKTITYVPEVKDPNWPRFAEERLVILLQGELSHEALDAASRDDPRRLLYTLFGTGHFKDLSEWFALQAKAWSFHQRDETPLVVTGRDIIARATLEGDEVQGEIGLELKHPGEVTRSTITLCYTRRSIGEEQHRFPVNLIGVVNDDALIPNDSHTRIARDPKRSRRHRAILDALPALASQLGDAHRRARRRRPRAVIALHALDLLDYILGERGWKALEDPNWSALARLELFTLADERVVDLATLKASADAHDGELFYIDPEHAPGQLLEGPLVLSCMERHLTFLRAYFNLRDHNAGWQRERRFLEWRNRASPLPEVPEDALASRQIDHQDELTSSNLKGAIWVPADLSVRMRVDFGLEGRAVEAIAVSERFPCCGAIEGASIAEDHRSAKVTRSQLRMLEEAANELVLSIIDDFEAQPDDRVRRRYLQEVVVSLWEQRSSGRFIETLKRLRKLTVLQLPNGRAISLEVALTEKPEELLHLGLWEDVEEEDEEDDTSTRSPRAVPKKKQRSLRRRRRKRTSTGRRSRPEFDEEPAPAPTPRPKPRPASKPEPTKAKSRPAPAPAPEPEPESLLLEALLAELHLVRAKNDELLSDLILERVTIEDTRSKSIVSCSDTAYTVNLRHPLVAAALEHYEADPVWVSLLASSVYTAINHELEEITDANEVHFHEIHSRLIQTGL